MQCRNQLDKRVLAQRIICDAIDFYIAWLNSENNSKVLTPALESVISGRIGDMENRLARILFKMAVGQAMMMHVVSGTNEIDAVKFQKG